MRFISVGFAITLLSAPLCAQDKPQCDNKPVKEVVTFDLVAGASIAEFKKAAIAVEKQLQTMSGFQQRQLLRGNQGGWIDIVGWQELAKAQVAAETLQQDSVAQHFFGFIDPQSIAINYYCE